MIAYFVLWFFIGMVCLLFRYMEKTSQKEKIFVGIIFVCLLFFIGLRSETVGADSASYIQIFGGHVDKKTKYFLSLEPAFRLFVKSIKYFSDNFTVFFFCLAILPLFIIMKYIGKWSENIYISVICFLSLGYYFIMFNASRQYIAIAILLIAFEYADKKEWKKALGVMVLAIFFHSTAIVFVICIVAMAILSNNYSEETCRYILNRQQQKALNVFVLLLTISTVFLPKILGYLLMYSPKYRQAYYENTIRNSSYFSSGWAYILFINAAIWFTLIFFTPSASYSKRKFIVPISLAFLFSVLQFRLNIMARFVWYFDIYSIFAIPGIMEDNIFSKGSKNIVKLTIVILCFVTYTYFVVNNYQRIVPYSVVSN